MTKKMLNERYAHPVITVTIFFIIIHHIADYMYKLLHKKQFTVSPEHYNSNKQTTER